MEAGDERKQVGSVHQQERDAGDQDPGVGAETADAPLRHDPEGSGQRDHREDEKRPQQALGPGPRGARRPLAGHREAPLHTDRAPEAGEVGRRVHQVVRLGEDRVVGAARVATGEEHRCRHERQEERHEADQRCRHRAAQLERAGDGHEEVRQLLHPLEVGQAGVQVVHALRDRQPPRP